MHTVRPGETLDGIARLYRTPAEVLQAANPGLDPERLRVGEALRIPAGAPAQALQLPGVGSRGTSQPAPAPSSKPNLPPAVEPPPPAK